MKDRRTSAPRLISQDLQVRTTRRTTAMRKRFLQSSSLLARRSLRHVSVTRPVVAFSSVKDPLNTTYLIDIDASQKFRSHMRDRCPCITKSRPSGLLGGRAF